MTTNSRSRSRKRKRVARSETGHSQAGGDGFVEVRGGNGRLLFRYDAARELVEVKPKGVRRRWWICGGCGVMSEKLLTFG